MRVNSPLSGLLLFASLRQSIASPTGLPSQSLSTITAPHNTIIARQALTTPSPLPTQPPQNEYFLTTNYITIDGFTNAHATNPAKTITLVLPTCSQTITPDENGYVPPGTCGALYNYYPSFVAAIVAGVIFGVLSITHLVFAIKYRIAFSWVLIMGASWACIGFLVRAVSTRMQQNTSLVLVSQTFILLVPLWINAYIYILLAHLINSISPTSSVFRIPAPLLSFIFVILDFISFVIQLIGGSIAGPTASPTEQMRGIHIYMGGIGIQQFFIVVFVGVAVRFQLDVRRVRELAKEREGWQRVLWAVYAGLGLITIRIIYRLIEFSAGQDQDKNPLPYREIYLYVLEVLPISLAILVFLVVHPGRVLKGQDAKMPNIWAWWKMRKLRVTKGKDEEGVGLEEWRGSDEHLVGR